MDILISGNIRSEDELLTSLQRLADHDRINRDVVSQIERYSEETIFAAIGDVVSEDLPATESDLKLQELVALCHAAAHGAPPEPSPTPGAPPQFEVIQEHVRNVVCPNGRQLRITPVSRLRVVMVQRGYRRLDPLNQVVDCVYVDGQRRWYPGVELFGEGLFIDLCSEHGTDVPEYHFQLNGSVASTWFDAWRDPERFRQNTQPDEQDQLHPVFVWWHTLAHRFINALSVDSGYSSAAIRERILIDVDIRSGNAAGGILLYTVQQGGDGTLGGMIALVPEFERVLESAFRNLDACSNDPLCGEETFAPGKYNGSACYACALASETSCEHRNMRLDRNLLLENLP